jgi:cytoskeleton protein RodZ
VDFRLLLGGKSYQGNLPVFRYPMSSFGEDLRLERTSRGIALEQITAVTKISQHLLLALEQDRFRQLPGGILNKGIVRGYAGAIGLDQHDWTERFLKAYVASGQVILEDPDWTAFASNVGRARLQRREAVEFRVRWLGAFLLLLAVASVSYLIVRYYGVRVGWWATVMPHNSVALSVHWVYDSVRGWLAYLLSKY